MPLPLIPIAIAALATGGGAAWWLSSQSTANANAKATEQAAEKKKRKIHLGINLKKIGTTIKMEEQKIGQDLKKIGAKHKAKKAAEAANTQTTATAQNVAQAAVDTAATQAAKAVASGIDETHSAACVFVTSAEDHDVGVEEPEHKDWDDVSYCIVDFKDDAAAEDWLTDGGGAALVCAAAEGAGVCAAAIQEEGGISVVFVDCDKLDAFKNLAKQQNVKCRVLFDGKSCKV